MSILDINLLREEEKGTEKITTEELRREKTRLDRGVTSGGRKTKQKVNVERVINRVITPKMKLIIYIKNVDLEDPQKGYKR